MGICLSCLRGRSKPSPETEPLLPVHSDSIDEPTPQTRDLDAVVTFVSDSFVDIVNLDPPPLTEPTQDLPPLEGAWVWPELGPLGEQDEQLLDTTHDSLKSAAISLETSAPLSVELS